MVARLRFPNEQSRLRRHHEPPDPDTFRSPFHHDRDRIIHSRAFRRLAAKTQVTTLPDSSHLRTRLTHTIEVAQVARTVATALRLNVDLVEALALGHDLGHPPFGHTGEAALDREMRRFGSSFDHNFHALRIVEQFERRYAAFPGLNLTFEVREGLVKHSRELDPDDPRYSEYEPRLRPPLEAQLIDLADEIAYLTADMEDAVEEGFLSLETIGRRVPAFAGHLERVRASFPGIGDRRVLNETQRRLIGTLVRGLIKGTQDSAAESGARDFEDVRRLQDRIASSSEASARTMREIRNVLSQSYYNAIAMQRIAGGYADTLSEQFRYYLDHPESLPSRYVERLGEEPLHQLVCDYIAGMTDIYLLRRHEEIFGARNREALRETSP